MVGHVGYFCILRYKSTFFCSCASMVLMFIAQHLVGNLYIEIRWIQIYIKIIVCVFVCVWGGEGVERE